MLDVKKDPAMHMRSEYGRSSLGGGKLGRNHLKEQRGGAETWLSPQVPSFGLLCQTLTDWCRLAHKPGNTEATQEVAARAGAPPRIAHSQAIKDH